MDKKSKTEEIQYLGLMPTATKDEDTVRIDAIIKRLSLLNLLTIFKGKD